MQQQQQPSQQRPLYVTEEPLYISGAFKIQSNDIHTKAPVKVGQRSRVASSSSRALGSVRHRQGFHPTLDKIEATDLDELEEVDQLDVPVTSEKSAPVSIPTSAPTLARSVTATNQSGFHWQVLLHYDNGLQLILDHIKIYLSLAENIIQFLQRRAALEDTHARQLLKLKSPIPSPIPNGSIETMIPSFSKYWQNMLQVHETQCEKRSAFADTIRQVVQSFKIAIASAQRSRKDLKLNATLCLKNVQQAEATVLKAKQKYDTLQSEWEKQVLARTRYADESSLRDQLHSLLHPNQTPEQWACTRAEQANSLYRQHLSTSQRTRDEYQSVHLPRLLRQLAEVDEECAKAISVHLERYLALQETSQWTQYQLITNTRQQGETFWRESLKTLDWQNDLWVFVQQYGRVAPTIISEPEKSVWHTLKSTFRSPKIQYPHTSVFGNEPDALSHVLSICFNVIEKHGLRSVGLYRLSGTSSHVAELREAFEREQNLEKLQETVEQTHYIADMNCITSLVKIYLRSLPTALISPPSYEEWMSALKITEAKVTLTEDRLETLKSLIGQLPQGKRVTLAALCQHLNTISQHERENKMSAHSLSLVFSPMVLRPPQMCATQPDAVAWPKMGNADGLGSMQQTHATADAMRTEVTHAALLMTWLIQQVVPLFSP